MSKEKFAYERVDEKTLKKVHDTISELKAEGYDINLEETSDEFIVKFPKEEPRAIHFLKRDHVLVQDKNGEAIKPPPAIHEVIRAAITHPGENLYNVLMRETEKKN